MRPKSKNPKRKNWKKTIPAVRPAEIRLAARKVEDARLKLPAAPFQKSVRGPFGFSDKPVLSIIPVAPAGKKNVVLQLSMEDVSGIDFLVGAMRCGDFPRRAARVIPILQKIVQQWMLQP